MNIEMRKGLSTLSLALIATFLITSTALAFDAEKTTLSGVKFGFKLPGTVTIDDVDFDSDTGFSFGGFIDKKLSTAMYVGIFADWSAFSVEGSDFTQLDLGVSLKGLMVSETGDFKFRPGIGIGLGVEDAEGVDDKAGLLVGNIFLEAIYAKEGSLPWLGEVGFTFSEGGTADVDIYSGPIFFIRGGLLF